jgi:hypothetical protein
LHCNKCAATLEFKVFLAMCQGFWDFQSSISIPSRSIIGEGADGGPHSPLELEVCSPVPVVINLEVCVMLVLAVEYLHLSLNQSIRWAWCACPTDLSQVCCGGLCQEAVFKCLLEQTLKPSPDFSFSAWHLQT